MTMTAGNHSLDYVNELCATTPIGPCPDWCTLPTGHGWDSVDHDGTLWSGHQGPQFGFLSCGGQEKSDAVGTVALEAIADDLTDLDADDLRDLARDALAAAEWLEANQ